MMSRTHHAIQDLRQQSQQKVLESILLFIAALYITALLPSILVRYVYTDPNMIEQPKLLEYIPVAAFAIAVLYMIYSLVGNFTRGKKIAQLQRELDEMAENGYDDCGCNDLDDAELAELEAIVEDVLQEEPVATKKTSKTTVAKKANKKTRK